MKAVLFDFAGTLFSPQPAARWVASAARNLGARLSDDEISRLAERCLTAGLPGAPYPSAVPDQLASAYARRDLSPTAHREAYVALLAGAAAGYPGLAEAIYELVLAPEGWVPYSDARDVVGALVGRGFAVGLISNVGFDIRPILRHHGFDELARCTTLSFEQQVIKPDPRIFEAALLKLGTDAASTLMVGDNPGADGGAAALGMQTLIWPMSPPGSRHGLARVLSVVGEP
jgi:HAD superfamily hydrolase (TIGR01509 family)